MGFSNLNIKVGKSYFSLTKYVCATSFELERKISSTKTHSIFLETAKMSQILERLCYFKINHETTTISFLLNMYVVTCIKTPG